MAEPVVVAEGPAGENRWGRWQFPVMHRLHDGRIVVFVHVEADAATAYGLPKRIYTSPDNGRSWREDPDAASQAYGLRLPNNDWLRIDTPPALPADGLALPRSVGEMVAYKQTYTMYRLRDLPLDLRQIFFQRFHDGRWRSESTEMTDPAGVRYTVDGLFPRLWWGDMRISPNGDLYALVYPGIVEGEGQFRFHAACYRSRDMGKTWQLRGRILYRPDPSKDSKAGARNGFSEPALEILKDGSMLAVLRTTDGNGVGPMYISRSTNRGGKWTHPAVFTETGVLPRLLLLKQGTLVLASGRPGVDLRFSHDGQGIKWTAPLLLVPITGSNIAADSCGYADLLPLEDNSFLIVYSWFKRSNDGALRKAILVRKVEVN